LKEKKKHEIIQEGKNQVDVPFGVRDEKRSFRSI